VACMRAYVRARARRKGAAGDAGHRPHSRLAARACARLHSHAFRARKRGSSFFRSRSRSRIVNKFHLLGLRDPRSLESIVIDR